MSDTITISTQRYIQLLEAENGLYRIQASLTVFKAPAQPEAPTVKPYVPPFGMQNCNLNTITQKIHATGITVKQWAKDNGFRDGSVRSVICGNLQSRAITDALIRDGFMEAGHAN